MRPCITSYYIISRSIDKCKVQRVPRKNETNTILLSFTYRCMGSIFTYEVVKDVKGEAYRRNIKNIACFDEVESDFKYIPRLFKLGGFFCN